MIENQKIRPARVIGPLGEPLTLDSLPPPDTTRWVVRRKAEVVAAVNGGLLTVDEVCERYGLSVEEFAGWQRAIDRSRSREPFLACRFSRRDVNKSFHQDDHRRLMHQWFT